MLVCPACETDLPEGAAACPRCGLAAELFEPVRSALGGRDGAQDPHLLREILLAVGGDPGQLPAGGPGAIAQPARFPAAAAVRRPAPMPAEPRPVPELPGLPPGPVREALRAQIAEYLNLGRRMGVETGHFEARAKEAVRIDDPEGYAGLRRDLFVTLAAALAEQLEQDRGRRQELAGLPAAELPEALVEAAEEALTRGDLPLAYRKRRELDDRLRSLEESWGTVQLLALECELLSETLRELGGDPGPAIGPYTEGRARVSAGDRAAAEPLLARAVLALWQLTAPRFVTRVGEIHERLSGAETLGRETAPARHALQACARALKAHNYGEAVLAYREARDLSSALETGAGEPAETVAARSPPERA